ncbi:hypothetical protein ACH5RR_005227 [Cinchona calisaya]|uniref:Uncharacterized protein n=1 Tax=Cinchona calisaya TaxID=153742 RepID=A0ABD3AKK1_9GENT
MPLNWEHNEVVQPLLSLFDRLILVASVEFQRDGKLRLLQNSVAIWFFEDLKIEDRTFNFFNGGIRGKVLFVIKQKTYEFHCKAFWGPTPTDKIKSKEPNKVGLNVVVNAFVVKKPSTHNILGTVNFVPISSSSGQEDGDTTLPRDPLDFGFLDSRMGLDLCSLSHMMEVPWGPQRPSLIRSFLQNVVSQSMFSLKGYSVGKSTEIPMI